MLRPMLSDYDVDGWIDIFVANCFYGRSCAPELLRIERLGMVPFLGRGCSTQD